MKVILITGGGRGIGASAATQCAARGYGVILTYKDNPQAAAETVKRIEAAGGKALALRLDVGDTGGFRAFRETVLQSLQSAWGQTRLAHVYVSQEQFALGCIALLDREPREMQLRELTFQDDEQQTRRFHQLIQTNWDEPGERLLSSSLASALLDHALLTQVGLRDGLQLKGGLAAYQRRQLIEYIEHRLAEPLNIGQLAAQCALSRPMCR